MNVIAVKIFHSVRDLAKNLALKVQLAGFHYVLILVLRYIIHKKLHSVLYWQVFEIIFQTIYMKYI